MLCITGGGGGGGGVGGGGGGVRQGWLDSDDVSLNVPNEDRASCIIGDLDGGIRMSRTAASNSVAVMLAFGNVPKARNGIGTKGLRSFGSPTISWYVWVLLVMSKSADTMIKATTPVEMMKPGRFFEVSFSFASAA